MYKILIIHTVYIILLLTINFITIIVKATTSILCSHNYSGTVTFSFYMYIIHINLNIENIENK